MFELYKPNYAPHNLINFRINFRDSMVVMDEGRNTVVQRYDAHILEGKNINMAWIQ